MIEGWKEGRSISFLGRHTFFTSTHAPLNPSSCGYSFLNYITISKETELHCTIRTITFLMLIIFIPLLLLLLLLILLLLQQLYHCIPSPFIQLFTIITHVGQVGKTWNNYVKYDEIKDIIIMITLTFKIRF